MPNFYDFSVKRLNNMPTVHVQSQFVELGNNILYNENKIVVKHYGKFWFLSLLQNYQNKF